MKRHLAATTEEGTDWDEKTPVPDRPVYVHLPCDACGNSGVLRVYERSVGVPSRRGRRVECPFCRGTGSSRAVRLDLR